MSFNIPPMEKEKGKAGGENPRSENVAKMHFLQTFESETLFVALVRFPRILFDFIYLFTLATECCS